jgi:hypothetical protein
MTATRLAAIDILIMPLSLPRRADGRNPALRHPATGTELGSHARDGRTYIASAWWIVTFPGLGLLLIVLGINLTGDWLRDRLDPSMPR